MSHVASETITPRRASPLARRKVCHGEAVQRRSREKVPEIPGESSDTLTLYLREVRRTELFTAEEFETATRARAGDFAARQSMIEHNLRLVVASPRPTWAAACRCRT